jgi:hypothetical protein
VGKARVARNGELCKKHFSKIEPKSINSVYLKGEDDIPFSSNDKDHVAKTQSDPTHAS